MTETAHTPGPWLVHGGMLGHKGDVFSPTAKSITDCHHIARCFAPKPETKLLCELHAIQATSEAISVIEANARLIAAAPDLAEALRQMIALAETSPKAGPSASHAEADLAWAQIEKARSVLSKATA